MSYDLKVLSVKSKDIFHVNFQSSIQVMNEVEDGFFRYKDIWPHMTNTEGIWYSLVKEHDGLYDAYDICDSNFEIEEKDIDMPYWIDDVNIRYDLTPLIIRSEFKSDFQIIIKSLINTSPTKTIMILASYQSHDKEIVCGALSFDEYFNLLDKGKILFNVCYIVSIRNDNTP